MSFRVSMIALWLVCAGCGADAATEDSDRERQQGATLTLEGAAERHMLPNRSIEIAVRYQAPWGEARAGVPIEAVFADVAPGASLPSGLQETDDEGRARFTVRAGSMPASFQVRMSGPDTEPVFVKVTVRQALDPYVRVRIVYPGEREVQTRVVTLIQGMACERVLAEGLTGDPTLSVQDPNAEIGFDLGPDLPYAVAAWARDATGARVAVGCEELTAPNTAVDAEADVELELTLSDIPLQLGGSHDIVADLNVEEANARLREKTLDSVRAALPDTDDDDLAQAGFFLDAIAVTEGADVEAVTQARAAGLDAALADALTSAQLGPLVLAQRLADQLLDKSASMTLRAQLRVVNSSLFELRVQSLLAQPKAVMGSEVPAIDVTATVTGASLEGRYLDSRAALRVDALRVAAGLGSYADALWTAAVGEDGWVGRFAPDFGCSLVVEALVAEGVTACGGAEEDCVRSACETALVSLMNQVRADLHALDDEGSELRLAGQISAHERDEDGIIDDLGPGELQGHWTEAQLADPSGPAVSALVRAAPLSTLTL